jgi:sialidase-1
MTKKVILLSIGCILATPPLLGARARDQPAELRARCLKVLREALKSKEFWPSMHAAEALTQAGHAKEVLAALKDRLKSERDDQKRCGLAREQARAGDRSKVAVLLEILGKKDDRGHIHAAESLYKIGEAGDGKLLRKALANKDKPILQLMAAAALHRAGDRKTLPLIRMQLAEGSSDSKMIAAWLLARYGDKSDLPQLRRNAREEKDPLKQAFALNALACLGDTQGKEALARSLNSTDPNIRAYAAEAVAACRARALAGKLEKLLDDKGVDVRVRAAQALMALTSPNSIQGKR